MTGTSAPRLRGPEVHVWAADLDDTALAALADSIDPSEHARAGRFLDARHGRRFAGGRGLLRFLLGRYLDEAPETLAFRYGECGKPALAGSAGRQALRFNVAHAGPLGLFALARGREVGIDVEQVVPERASLRIADNFFSPAEAELLRRLPERARSRAFFACWTRREAYLKAIGCGLSALEVDLSEPAPSEGWLVRELPVATGYAAALAAQGADWRVRMLRFSSESLAVSSLRAPSVRARSSGLGWSAKAGVRSPATSGRR